LLKLLKSFQNWRLRKELDIVRILGPSIKHKQGRQLRLTIARMFDNLGENAHAKVLEVYRLHREQKKFRDPSDNNYILYFHVLRVAIMLSNEATLEKFRQIPKEKRLSIPQAATLSLNESGLLLIMRCFELADNPKQSLADVATFTSVDKKDLQKIHEFYLTFPKTHPSVSWKPSDRFQDLTWTLALDLEIEIWDNSYFTATYILRLIYGEEAVMEFLQLCKTDKFDLKINDIPEFLKDWGALRQYPLDWGVLMINRGV
jgi:hypothetical protein